MRKVSIKPVNRLLTSEDFTSNPEVIRAKGDIRIRMTIIILVGLITLTLIGIGVWAHKDNPETAKNLWVIIGPMISGGLSGLVGYGLGQKAKSSE